MRLWIILLTAFLIVTVESYSQTDSMAVRSKKGELNLSFLTAYNFWRHHYVELGLAINRLDFDGDHHIMGWNCFISTEVKIDNELLIGPKAGVWFGADTGGLGLNLIYYTDFDKGAWRTRPELGIGLSRFKITYGYNIALSNKDFANVNKSNICLNFLIGLKTLTSLLNDIVNRTHGRQDN